MSVENFEVPFVDPELDLNENPNLVRVIASEIHALKASKNQTEDHINSLVASLASLEALIDDPTVVNQIQQLRDLVMTLDIDGDGTLSELVGIDQIARSALAKAEEALQKVETANQTAVDAKAIALESKAAATTAQSTANDAVAKGNENAQTLVTHGQRITDLENAASDPDPVIDAYTKEEVEKLVTSAIEADRRDRIQANIARRQRDIAAFQEELDKPYPVYTRLDGTLSDGSDTVDTSSTAGEETAPI